MTTRQRLKGSCEFQCRFTLADSYAGSEPRRASGDWRSVEGERSHERWWRGVDKVQQDRDEHRTNETEMGWRGGVGAGHEVGSSRSEGDYGRDEVGGGWGRGREYGKNFGRNVASCLHLFGCGCVAPHTGASDLAKFDKSSSATTTSLPPSSLPPCTPSALRSIVLEPRSALSSSIRLSASHPPVYRPSSKRFRPAPLLTRPSNCWGTSTVCIDVPCWPRF